MGQTLLDMAKAQFKTYDIIMGVARDDESQVKSAAYHLQQSVELMLGPLQVCIYQTHSGSN